MNLAIYLPSGELRRKHGPKMYICKECNTLQDYLDVITKVRVINSDIEVRKICSTCNTHVSDNPDYLEWMHLFLEKVVI